MRNPQNQSLTVEQERRVARRRQRQQDQRIRALETLLQSSPPTFPRYIGEVTRDTDLAPD